MEMRGLKLTQVTAVKEYYPVATHGDAWIETSLSSWLLAIS